VRPRSIVHIVAPRDFLVSHRKNAVLRFGSRVILLPIVIATGAALVALGLFPAFGSAGRAIKRFDGLFLGGQKDRSLKIPLFPERSTIYAADGSVLATVFLDQDRKIVALDDVNQTTRDAVLAIEDHGFYRHGPVDLSSIVRALFANIRAGAIVQGGSTITQQLVKNTETGQARTFARKLQEAQLAIRLENTYTKNQIFEAYLNEIYLGNRVYGIGTAAEFYFNRHLHSLSLPQAALLAGMIAAPERWDPFDHPEAARGRRDEVLGRMWRLGLITPDQFLGAVNTPIKLSSRGRDANKPGTEPYFVSSVVRSLLTDSRYSVLGKTYQQRKLAVFQGGLKIYTTIDPKMQAQAQQAMAGRLPHQGPVPPADPQAALVSVVPQTGAIRAMVGGNDYSKNKFNLASQSKRSTGSAFKAFTLAAAIEHGVPPGKVYDSKTPIFIPECDDWTVNNAEPGTGGFMNLWGATAASVNVIFAQLIRDVGPENVAEVAERMGIGADIPPYCSITLGTAAVSPLQMTTAYSTLANNGIHCKPYTIQRILSRTGKTVYRNHPSCKRAISAQVAAQVTAMLEGVIAHGTGTAANIGRPEAGKTGTGQDYRDAGFMGYIPQLCTGVWVGYSKAEISMRALPVLGYRNAFGGTIAAPIWHDFMVRAVARMPVRDFPTPPPQKSGTVPDVVGLKKQKAIDTLAQASFTAIVNVVDSLEPAGTVVAQSPAGGSAAPLGSGVTINVSNGKGPKQAKVPDVVGDNVNGAQAILEALGFKVSIVYQTVDKKKDDGIVLSQSPAGGASKPVGSTVTIVVGQFSAAPEPSPSPGGG
jgi:penicillin-binding protein 1A